MQASMLEQQQVPLQATYLEHQVPLQDIYHVHFDLEDLDSRILRKRLSSAMALMLKWEVAVMMSLNLSVSCQWSHACQLQDPCLLIRTIHFPKPLREIMLSCFLNRLLRKMANKRVVPWLSLVSLSGSVNPENQLLWISRSLQVFPCSFCWKTHVCWFHWWGAIFCYLWLPQVSWAHCSYQPSLALIMVVISHEELFLIQEVSQDSSSHFQLHVLSWLIGWMGSKL